MELQHFSHNHPLVFNEGPSHETEKAVCSGCEEVISGPRFSCVTCGFHLDNNCAKAPSEINHPFHRNHSLTLLASSPYGEGNCICSFCDNYCEKFVYHCSCKLDLHIKCALFLYDIAQKKKGDQLQNIAYTDPSCIPTENHSEELKEAKCFACWEPLLDSAYLSLDCGSYLHKKCAELPLEINHLTHRHHSLFLQLFTSDLLPCKICEKTQLRAIGLLYCCSICKFGLHLKCVSPPPIIEDINSHEHPFTRWLRPSSFTCDACGTLGNYLSYICSTCGLILHKMCISLPRIIKNVWHQHPVFHTYFVVDNEPETLECEICHEEVNKECGSYCCPECRYVLHVNCALQDPEWYYEIDPRKLNENAMLIVYTMDPSFFVFKRIRLGEYAIINTQIKHFSHQHNLVLNNEEKDHRCCDGCSQLITTYFYRCLQCDFFLHKSCAELPGKKHIWFVYDETPFNLVSDGVFKCAVCGFLCSGFSYKCSLIDVRLCVRCANISRDCTQGHKHRLLFYHRYNGQCNACGGSIDDFPTYRCKDCDFNVHYKCTLLPPTAPHKCDQHFLTLTYHDDYDYSDHHYCDICEQKRNPNIWFYHCAICDTSAHPDCVLGGYRFLKLGTSIFIGTYHPHSLVFVQKVYHYTECCECGKPCLGLAFECSQTRCHYIIHLTCVENFPYILFH